MGAPKSPNNVTSTFLNIVNLLPEDLSFKHGGAKLASCPGRHLTSLRPCSRAHVNFQMRRKSLSKVNGTTLSITAKDRGVERQGQRMQKITRTAQDNFSGGKQKMHVFYTAVPSLSHIEVILTIWLTRAEFPPLRMVGCG